MYDEWCDPQTPHVLSFEEIAAAAYRIKYGVERTPCTVCISKLVSIDFLLFGLYSLHICRKLRAWIYI